MSKNWSRKIAATLVLVGAGSAVLFFQNCSQSPSDSSSSISPNATTSAVAPPGDVWGLNVNASGAVFRLTSSDTFMQMPGNMNEISIGADDSIWAVDLSDIIYTYNSVGGWEVIPGSLKTVHVGNAQAVWGVNLHSDLYHYANNTWVQYPGNVDDVSVGGDGTVWTLHKGVPSYYVPSTDSFVAVSGKLMSSLKVGNMNSVWALDSLGNVYKYNGASSWTQTTGTLSEISVGFDGSAWGVNTAGVVFQYNGQVWNAVSTGALANLALANITVASASTIFGLDFSSNVYQYSPQSGFTQIPNITLSSIILQK